MGKIGVVVNVVGNDPLQSLCSEINLFVATSSSMKNDCNVVALLGLPVEITNEEFEQFIEPFLPQIDGFVILLEVNDPLVYSHGDASSMQNLQQYKKVVILSFDSDTTKIAFIHLYNNMQIPLYSEVAPCLVVAVDHLEVIYCESQKESDLSRNSVLDVMVNANQFSTSLIDESVTSSLVQLLQTSPTLTSRRECNTTGWTTPQGISHKSPAQRVSPINTTSKAGSSDVDPLVDAHQIPTCVVCLRRLVTAGRLIDGAGDLRICRSYIYDNNMATVRRFENSESIQFVSKSPKKTQSPNAKKSTTSSFEDVHTESDCLRCIVCHVYNTISKVKYSGHNKKGISISNSSNSSSSSGAFESTINSNNSGRTNIDHGESSSSPRPPGSYCLDCGLGDNLWLCMLCSYTGCGRYKAQHAQQHYLSSGHTLSLELISGRIWDYFSDTFAHIDDSAALQHRESTHNYRGEEEVDEDAPEMEEQFRFQNNVNGGDVSPSPRAKGGGSSSSVSFLVGSSANGATLSKDKPHARYLQGADANDPSSLLDSGTMDKMEGLMRHYEDLLQGQLSDQQLHYEKLLARETVRALEATYRQASGPINNSNHGSKNSKGGASKGGKSITGKASSGRHLSGTEFKDQNDDSPLPLTDPDAPMDMADIEAVKMEISLLEAQQRAVLDQVKAVEEETRGLRRQNDVLVKEQKILREQEAEFLLKEEACKQRCAATVAEMEQQIRDLEFYTRTRKEMQISPFKEELRDATVITRQSSTSSMEDTATRSSNEKVEKKGYRKYKK